MSKIDELIAELCPDGVEYLNLTELADYVRGVTYRKEDEKANGPIAVLRANNITLSSNTLNFDNIKRVSSAVRVREDQRLYYGDILICAGSGSKEHIGKVAYISGDLPYTFGGFMAVIRSKGTIDSRFLFHFLTGKKFSDYLGQALSTTTINNLSSRVIQGFRVPLPPLEIQQEIVRILDKFTQLEAELEAELEARSAQYEFYRGRLLTLYLSQGAKKTTLGEICRRVSSGGTPKSDVKHYYEGNIPWLRTQEVDFKDIWGTEIQISEEGLSNSSARWIPAGCVIVAMYGATAAKVAVNRIPLTTNQACCNLDIDSSVADFRYVYHWLVNEYPRLRALGQGSQSNLNARQVKNYPILIPPLEEQRRIANILDKFDALVNDISSGLPAEIAARRKQYEYYRDRLLTFKEK